MDGYGMHKRDSGSLPFTPSIFIRFVLEFKEIENESETKRNVECKSNSE